MSSDPVLQAENVWKSYWQGDREVSVLRNVDLVVTPGETLAVVGVSGSGKSTLLHLLAGLDQPDSGKIRLTGQDIGSISQALLGQLRNRHLGFVYQFHHLLPEFSALENVAMPMRIGGQGEQAALRRAGELLEQVSLSHRADHRPGALSGGERQRTAIARALVMTPSVVLADEPTGNLDEESAESIHQLILHLSGELDVAFVVVTHNTSFAARMQRVLRLHGGQLEPDE
jgi:lipoprotein-releasing system ATP-binding protein